MKLIDNLVSALFPEAGLRRERARFALAAINSHKRKYEGADIGRRTNGWTMGGSSSANAQIRGALSVLRERSSDHVRNNPYGTRAVNTIVNGTVGFGIMANPSGNNKQAEKIMRKAWKQWAESKACDVAEEANLYQQQRLAMRGIVERGEVIVLRRWRSFDRTDLSVPMQIQVLEGDYLDHSKDGVMNGNNSIIQGVEFNQSGKRVAYWLFESHPGEQTGRLNTQSIRRPAEDVLHVFRKDRSGQVRGVPWAAPVLLRSRDFDEYEDAQLVRQKIAACFTAFVTEPDGENPGLGSQLERLEPGAVEYLPIGKSVQFADPPGADNYNDYSRQVLHSIAAGWGVTYEDMTGDLSQVSYISGRLGRLAFYSNLDDWQWLMIIPDLLDGIWKWFAEAAVIKGLPADAVAPRWATPARAMTDPNTEVPTTIKAVRAGLQTLRGAIRERGLDPDDHIAEIEQTNKQLDDAGIVLDTDPRRITNGGQSQNTDPMHLKKGDEAATVASASPDSENDSENDE